MESHREFAQKFLAAYSKPDASEYERHLVAIARRWVTFLDSPNPSPDEVAQVLSELRAPVPEDYGSGWLDLRMGFEWWAREAGLERPP